MITVKALSNYTPGFKYGFLVEADSPIKGIAQLGGKKLGKLVGARAKNWVRPNQPPEAWGQILATDWEADLKFLGLEGKVPNVERYFTNEFIQEINDFDEAKIAEQARTYKAK